MADDYYVSHLKGYPRFLHRLFGHMTFSRLYLWRLKKRAAESQGRRCPGDYVYHFVQGDGETNRSATSRTLA